MEHITQRNYMLLRKYQYSGMYKEFGSNELAKPKLVKANRKKLRIVIGALLAVGLLLGFYSAEVGSIVVSEYGTVMNDFSVVPLNSQSNSAHFAYYYFAWWSGAYHNAYQAVVDAIYASGIGYIFNLIADVFDNQGYPLDASSIADFVVHFFEHAIDGANAYNDMILAAEDAGIDIEVTAAAAALTIAEYILFPLAVDVGAW